MSIAVVKISLGPIRPIINNDMLDLLLDVTNDSMTVYSVLIADTSVSFGPSV